MITRPNASGLNEPHLVLPSPHSSTAVRMKSCSQQNQWLMQLMQMERVVDFNDFSTPNLVSTVASRHQVAMNKLNQNLLGTADHGENGSWVCLVGSVGGENLQETIVLRVLTCLNYEISECPVKCPLKSVKLGESWWVLLASISFSFFLPDLPPPPTHLVQVAFEIRWDAGPSGFLHSNPSRTLWTEAPSQCRFYVTNVPGITGNHQESSFI